jgi:BNR repeat-like domain
VALPSFRHRNPGIPLDSGQGSRQCATAIFVALFVGLLAAAPAAAASARPMEVSNFRPISGTSPFPDGCGLQGERQPNSEAEPNIAVDPRHPRLILATWQQDRFVAAGGAATDVVARSKDRGQHWQRTTVPGASVCTGGQDQRTSDSWVSIGADGIDYAAVLTFDLFPGMEDFGTPTQQRVSRSVNGGSSFEPPVAVADDATYNDREAVTADPSKPGTAYLAWVKRSGLFGESGAAMFSRTTDGGQTWSDQRTIYSPPSGTLPDPSLIKVLPDGTLLYFFLLANGTPVVGAPVLIPFDVMVMRSTDSGDSWSQPQMIGQIPNPVAPVDPKTSAQVRAFPVIDAAVAPDGTAYVVWNEIFSKDSSEIFISSSHDGGQSWSAPGAVAKPKTQAFLPAIAVTNKGLLGVIWDDFTGDTSADNTLTAQVWFARSQDRGRNWTPQPLGRPFDMLTTARTSSTEVAGYFVGDYQGVAASKKGFVAVFAEGQTLGKAKKKKHNKAVRQVIGPSDVFFARLEPPRKHKKKRHHH